MTDHTTVGRSISTTAIPPTSGRCGSVCPPAGKKLIEQDLGGPEIAATGLGDEFPVVQTTVSRLCDNLLHATKPDGEKKRWRAPPQLEAVSAASILRPIRRGNHEHFIGAAIAAVRDLLDQHHRVGTCRFAEIVDEHRGHAMHDLLFLRGPAAP